jgi:hypothetical protein
LAAKVQIANSFRRPDSRLNMLGLAAVSAGPWRSPKTRWL